MAQDKPVKQEEKSPETQELKSSLDFTRTMVDKVAVTVIELLGSVIFLLICLFFFSGWICWNLGLLNGLKPFDPFPFPILDMIVSLFAIILTVLVLINQNRQGRIDKIRQQVEFEVNVRAENEITKVLNMLHSIHQKMGLDNTEDKELEEMKEPTDINKIHQALDSTVTDPILPANEDKTA
jgi:uncharacterized membrane protein